MKASASIILLELGYITVVAAAVVVAALLVGPGFLCPSAGILVLGAILIKVVFGFIRNPLRRRIVSLVSVAIFVCAVAGFTFCRTRPKALFLTYVADPIPASVRILHSEYQGGPDHCVYLHFRVSSGDVDAILRTREYRVSADEHGPSGYFPGWWGPEALTKPTLYSWMDKEEANAAWLWVNESKNEAFFTQWNF